MSNIEQIWRNSIAQATMQLYQAIDQYIIDNLEVDRTTLEKKIEDLIKGVRKNFSQNFPQACKETNSNDVFIALNVASGDQRIRELRESAISYATQKQQAHTTSKS